MSDYYVILPISESEFWEIAHDNNLTGVPKYYTVSRNGAVRFYPQLDESKVTLLYAREKE